MARDIACLILGCTHYPFLKEIIADIAGPGVALVAQDEIIPGKLADYLRRHPESDEKISRAGLSEFYVSDMTQSYLDAACYIYGGNIDVRHVVLPQEGIKS